MAIYIRKAKMGDAEQHTKLNNEVWRTAYAHILPKEVFDKRDAELERRVKTYGSWGLNKDGNVDYVAVDNERIVAILRGTSLSNYEHYRELGYADLMAIYIHQDYQHQGIGKKLFDFTISVFKKQGCDKMVIGVLKDNLQARKAYEKWGCILDKTYEKAFTISGKEYPEVFYIYDLN